jgi:uncharacterized protein YdaU (DUF1376 family)
MLPKDDATLQVLAGVSCESKAREGFNDRWTFVKQQFIDRGEYLSNERQLEELAAQTSRREQAEKAGHKSALARKEKRIALQRIIRQHVAESNGRSTDVKQTLNEKPTLQTPTSSSSSGLPIPLWWTEFLRDTQFERLTYEDAMTLFHGRGIDPEKAIKELLPIMRTANWNEVKRHGEARWLGWQLDDLNKRKKTVAEKPKQFGIKISELND